jgi:hypothetical protein
MMTAIASDRHRQLVAHLGAAPEDAGEDEGQQHTEPAGELRREIRGFLLNRLQFALVGECMHLVGEGYCSVEDIDAVLTAGLARRWSFIGPFEVAHLNATEGFKGFMTGLGPMVRSVSGDVQPDYPWDDALVARIHEELARRTPVAEIPQRQAWRDRQLMQIVQRLRDESN